MKYLLVIIVVALGVWLWLRGRESAIRQRRAPPKPAKTPDGPVEMVACAHCALQLPRTEALLDAAGRPFCSDAHRLAGPR